MDENNRPQRRTKTRPPYDLRRKVLLKNFLREQMSPIPLRTSLESLVNHEVADTSETEIVDIENYESTINATNLNSSGNVMNLDSSIDAMNLDSSIDAVDPLSSTDTASTSEMDIDEDSSTSDHNRSFLFKSTLTFDFTKITESKLSRFNYLKRKTPSLSAEAVKVIADKNSVHFESKEEQYKHFTAKVPVKESKYNTYISPWKRKPTIELSKKRGIIKAKNMLQSSKFPFKQQQADKGSHGNKSSKLSKVRKMIAAVHHAIKGDSPKVKSDSASENYLDGTRQTLPHCTRRFRNPGERFSDYDSFNNRITFDLENEENDADVPERVKMIKAIKKRQYCGKFGIPHEEPIRKPGLKNSNSFVSKLLGRKTLNRIVRSDLNEQDRSWTQNSDISWSLNEIRKLEKANKRLREENKLLSESLSSLVTGVNKALRTPPKPLVFDYDPCQSNNDSFNSKQEPDPYRAVPDTPRCKVLRSRSVQDRGERRREIKSRLSSRSMCHQQYSRIPPRTLYRAKPCIINPYPTDEFPQSQSELPSILSPTLDRNCAKPINRRFSMLESISKRPHVYRRSSFTYQDRTYNRQNLLSLPSEAFY